MPIIITYNIYCPTCNKLLGTNVDAVGKVGLFCKRCNRVHLIQLKTE